MKNYSRIFNVFNQTLVPVLLHVISLNLISLAANSELNYKLLSQCHQFHQQKRLKNAFTPKTRLSRLLNRVKSINMNALKQKYFRLLVSRVLFHFRWARTGVVRCYYTHVNVTLRACIQVISIKQLAGCGLYTHLKWKLPFTLSVC